MSGGSLTLDLLTPAQNLQPLTPFCTIKAHKGTVWIHPHYYVYCKLIRSFLNGQKTCLKLEVVTTTSAESGW